MLTGFGHIARTPDRSIIIDQSNPFFQITAEENGGISNGWFVYKQGRRTGWTYGWVTKSCFDIANYVSGIRMNCQFYADYLSDGGDSGGPVFAPYNGGYMLVGIHWAKKDDNGWGLFSGYRGIEIDLVGSRNSGRVFSY